jgi:hypothetical protein
MNPLSLRYTLHLRVFGSHIEIPFTGLQGYCFPVVLCGIAVFLFFPDPDEADHRKVLPAAGASSLVHEQNNSETVPIPAETLEAPRARPAPPRSVASQVGKAILAGPESRAIRVQTRAEERILEDWRARLESADRPGLTLFRHGADGDGTVHYQLFLDEKEPAGNLAVKNDPKGWQVVGVSANHSAKSRARERAEQSLLISRLKKSLKEGKEDLN